MVILRRLHIGIGLAGILAFVLTGQYMFHELGQLQHMADGPRMMYRASHIYLLLGSAINLVIGFYLADQRPHVPAWLQGTVSVLLLVAPLLFLAGFVIEPGQGFHRPWSSFGAYSVFGAMILLVSGAVWRSLRISR